MIKRGKTSKAASDAPPRKSKNTSVFVRGLPADTAMEELVSRFRKCGVLEEDEDGAPKVKMYARDDGTFSGEALVVFFKEDSVILACNLLDDAELRLGEAGTRMSVEKADFGHKGGGTQSSALGVEGGQGHQRKTVDRKKATRRITNMQRWVLIITYSPGFNAGAQET